MSTCILRSLARVSFSCAAVSLLSLNVPASAQCQPEWYKPAVNPPWSLVANGQPITCDVFVVHPSGDIIMGNVFGEVNGSQMWPIARFNPTTGQWTALATEPINGSVSSIACAPNGDIYIAGVFSQIGSMHVSYVAVYRESSHTWEALGTGVPGFASQIAVGASGKVCVVVGLGSPNTVHFFDPATSTWARLCENTPLGCLNGFFDSVNAVAVLNNDDVVIHEAHSSVPNAPQFKRWSQANQSWSSFFPSWIHGGGTLSTDNLITLPNGDLLMSAYNPPNPGPGYIAYFSVAQNTFAPLGLGVNNEVSRMALGLDGTLIASGLFTVAGGQPVNGMARYNFTTGAWSPIGTGACDAANALAGLANGDVYAGGFYYKQNGNMMLPGGFGHYTAADNRWHSPLGVNGEVNAVLNLPDGTSLVGGSFSIAGDAPASNIARYDSVHNTWTTLGSGCNGPVHAFTTLSSGEVAIGGAFSSAGGVGTTALAKWNPVNFTWSTFGTGIRPTVVHALVTLPNGDVVAGGESTIVSRRATRWSPATNAWVTLGNIGLSGGAGFGHAVLALAAAPNGDVFVGGNFPDPLTEDGNFKHWHASTNTYTTPGFGANGPVNALVMAPDGKVILGGEFSMLGTVNAPHVGRWDPSTFTWSSAGTGVNQAVHSLCRLSSGVIAVGGDFTIAGGLDGALSLALYNSSMDSWTRLPGDPNHPNMGVRARPNVGTASVYALAALQDNGFLTGGSFGATVTGAMTPFPVNNFAIFACAGLDCDSIDFNNDTSLFDPQDIDAFLSVYSEGPCIPASATCNDIDFNNDGSLFDPCDIDSFLLQFSEGPCTLCGV
ncbi:MAG: hypothetical protein U0640_01345 [Phycisphaerales bacterium]